LKTYFPVPNWGCL